MSSLWSVTLRSPVRGLSLAREVELLLVRDDNSTLWLLNANGELQGSVRLAGPTAACISDDGSILIAAGESGRVWRLSLDLTIAWERVIAAAALAAATDSFGQYIAVSDKKGGLFLFANSGLLLAEFESPRPIHYLAFIPATTQLAAAADFGWCGCLELTTGQWSWTDRPVSHFGSMAVAGGGETLLLACFSDGIRRYGPDGRLGIAVVLPSACGLVTTSFAGDIGAAAGASRQVFAFDRKGTIPFSLELEQTPSALALSALGDRLACGFANGTIKMLEFKSKHPEFGMAEF